jgi:hypothetical protein
MGFRVYDKKRKRWINDNIFLTPDGELVESKKSLLGDKLTFVDQNRYVYQKYIELNDKNNTPIYIGDYLEANVSEDRTVRGMVTFASELSSYIILCFDSSEYFLLGTEVCDRIEVVGNVFEDVTKGK